MQSHTTNRIPNLDKIDAWRQNGIKIIKVLNLAEGLRKLKITLMKLNPNHILVKAMLILHHSKVFTHPAVCKERHNVLHARSMIMSSFFNQFSCIHYKYFVTGLNRTEPVSDKQYSAALCPLLKI